MTGTAPLFEQYFREHAEVRGLLHSILSIALLMNASPTEDGSSAIHLSGPMILFSGSKNVDANG